MSIDPQRVQTGAEVDLVFSVPNEDDPVGIDHVTLGIPADFELDDAEAKPGWTQSRTGQAITWSGGLIPKGQFAALRDPRDGARRSRDGAVQRARRRPHGQVDHLPGGARRRRDRQPNDTGARSLGKAALGGRDRRRRPRRSARSSRAVRLAAPAPRPAVRPVLTSRSVLLFRQFVNDDLGCASYLVGDAEAGVAVVVDPPLAIEHVLAAAEQEGVRIERVLETHTHADHVSGHGRLALEHGLPVPMHPLAEAEFPSEPLADGDVVSVGAVTIRVAAHARAPPRALLVRRRRALVLTGDSLFVGDAARPDLAVAAREGAEDLYRSLLAARRAAATASRSTRATSPARSAAAT